jgi:hypothetical protein
MRRGSVSNWNPGDSLVIGSLVDPPQMLPGGVSAGTNATAAIGGDGGFPLPSKPIDDSAWCAVIEADQPEPVGDIRHLEHLLQNNKQAEGAALFQTLTRLREALATQLTRDSDAETPVSITAMDAVLLSRLLLKRLG